MSIATRAGAIMSLVFQTSRRRPGTALIAFACGAAAWFLVDPSAPRVVRSWASNRAHRIGAHSPHEVNAVFSPDGARFLMNDDAGAAVYDASNGDMITRLAGFDVLRDGLEHPADRVAPVFEAPLEFGLDGMKFTPDGRFAVGVVSLVGADRRRGPSCAAVWDIAAGRLVRRFDFPFTMVDEVALSADGARLAVPVADGTVEVWDLRRDALVAELKAVPPIAFSPDGRAIAARTATSAAVAGLSVRLWDLETGRALWTLDLNRPGFPFMTRLDFAPDGRSLLAWSRGGSLVAHWIGIDGALIEVLDPCPGPPAKRMPSGLAADCPETLIMCRTGPFAFENGQVWDWTSAPQRPVAPGVVDAFATPDQTTHLFAYRGRSFSEAVVRVEHRDAGPGMAGVYEVSDNHRWPLQIAPDGRTMLVELVKPRYPQWITQFAQPWLQRLLRWSPRWIAEERTRWRVFDLDNGRPRTSTQFWPIDSGAEYVLANGGRRMITVHVKDVPSPVANQYLMTSLVELRDIPPAHHPAWDYAPTALAACLGGLVGVTIETLRARRRRSKPLLESV